MKNPCSLCGVDDATPQAAQTRPTIQIENRYLRDRVAAEGQRRGIKALARVAAELITERLTQIDVGVVAHPTSPNETNARR